MNDYNKSVSDMVWSIRGIAIVLVAMCHSPSPEFPVFDTIRSIVGVIGVPVFFVCSGYFLKEKTSKEFFCDMAKKIIVPWAIWGGHHISMGDSLRSWWNCYRTDEMVCWIWNMAVFHTDVYMFSLFCKICRQT